MKQADAALLIGDDAIRESWRNQKYYDYGSWARMGQMDREMDVICCLGYTSRDVRTIP